MLGISDVLNKEGCVHTRCMCMPQLTGRGVCAQVGNSSGHWIKGGKMSPSQLTKLNQLASDSRNTVYGECRASERGFVGASSL
jgi:hypothetical protein